MEEGRSLRQLIQECYDFEHEHTLMQYVGAQLGVVINRTPKCHCEMAGEGIEYSLGIGKNSYRRLAIADKKTKEKFRESVKMCLRKEYVKKTG